MSFFFNQDFSFNTEHNTEHTTYSSDDDSTDSQSHYEVLGIDKNASQKEIKKAFRSQARKFHPDKHPNDRQKYKGLFQQVMQAYEVLKDPQKRAMYDQNVSNHFKNNKQIILQKHKISAHIHDRYATIEYLFHFENPNNTKTGSKELNFEITIDSQAFISKFEAIVDNELFVGKTKEKEQASKEYKEAKQKNENAILIFQPHKNIPNVFEIKTNIDGKSKIVLTITIEQYLPKMFDYIPLNIQILRNFNKSNIKQTFDYISFDFVVEDRSGIFNVCIQKSDSDKIIINQKIMDKLNEKCVINGKILADSSINELTLRYNIKGEQNDNLLFDSNCNTFCHIISDIVTDAVIENIQDINEGKNDNLSGLDNIVIPRRVMFVIDRSGSMGGSKWDKTISSTIIALKQFRKGYDRFGIMLFDNKRKMIPYGDARGCILANDMSVNDAIHMLQNEKPGGSTNINKALLKAIKLIKIDILLLNNDINVEYNYYMNQIIFITDGEPNDGETDTKKIINNIKNANDLSKIDKYNNKISLFSFGVGNDSNNSSWIHDLNHSFLKLLSVNNAGFYQRIKQVSADEKLNEYFKILSKPILSNINIEYKNKNINNLTNTSFHTLYCGNDLIVCGKINDTIINNSYNILVNINAMTGKIIQNKNNKLITKPIQISKQIKVNINRNNNIDSKTNNTEKLWAYLTLQQLATQKLIYNDMIEIDDYEQKENELLPTGLALKYKLITPWTSMIVVKKKDENNNTIDIQYDNTQLPTQNNSNSGYGMQDGIYGRYGDSLSIFDCMFGGGSHSTNTTAKKSPEIRTILDITLEDVYAGGSKTIKIQRRVACKKDNASVTCSKCNGQGSTTHLERMGPMVLQKRSECSICNGIGYILDIEEYEIKCDIPIGCLHTEKITIIGEGHRYPNMIKGDVIVIIKVNKHKLYTRKGADLIMNYSLSLRKAICGYKIKIIHISGKRLIITPNDSKCIVKGGSVCVVYGMGLPQRDALYIKGNLYIVMEVKIPLIKDNEIITKFEKILPKQIISGDNSNELKDNMMIEECEFHSINHQPKATPGSIFEDDSDNDNDNDSQM